MDDKSKGENVQSILTYGAQQLFNESSGSSRDIVYSEEDIDNLITKTKKEGDQENVPKEGAAFAFAKIWTADKDELEELANEELTRYAIAEETFRASPMDSKKGQSKGTFLNTLPSANKLSACDLYGQLKFMVLETVQ
ncbi:MAG: hypothetical protein NXY57DRAFT_1042073 [Lentinula lateritia]|nr:MAG: hypothetical protein NXY57DRAFT_1042073 [Lentinula lateritia]